jgi:hypothetical protein
VLEIARLKIPDMYNLLSKRPVPLIPRDLVFGIAGTPEGGRHRAGGARRGERRARSCEVRARRMPKAS